MLSFLFWNLKQPRADTIANLARTHAVDVVMLAECPLAPASVLKALNRESASFYFVPSKCPKLAIYTKFSDEYLKAEDEGVDYSVRSLSFPDETRLELLLCVVHLPSKLRQSPDDQFSYAAKFTSQVLNPAEARAKHGRTVLVGDLNMNPYDTGVVVDCGFHAVTTRAIALRELRTVKFPSNVFFYNPMWRHFGEQAQGHAGTYFYRSPKARADYWNIYDQVLLRPKLLPYFDDEDLEIIYEDPVMNASFLQKGLPNEKRISDHLPILFRLRV